MSEEYKHDDRLEVVVKSPIDTDLVLSEVEEAINSIPWFYVEDIEVTDYSE